MPRGSGESGKAWGEASTISAGSGSTAGNIIGSTKKIHQGREHTSTSSATDDILDDEEESMDWWTKYFASVDAMIEVCPAGKTIRDVHYSRAKGKKAMHVPIFLNLLRSVPKWNTKHLTQMLRSRSWIVA